MAADLIGVEHVSSQHAARVFQAAGVIDPEGRASPAGMAAGTCVRVRAPRGAVVVSYTAEPTRLWCIAAAGEGAGADRIQACDAVLSLIAKRQGLRLVAFQTARRGLVRRARALGYRVTGRAGRGWIMTKALA